jgi:hypothetical protein
VSEAPRHNQLWAWAWASDSDKREESRGRKLEARAEMWHSQETAHDRPHTDSNGVLAWYWESVNPNRHIPTQRCGAVGFLRVHVEEDVNQLTA